MTDPQVLANLLDRLNRLERRSLRLRMGEVTDDSPLSVDLGDSGNPYTDVKTVGAAPVGTTVAAVMGDRDLLILGAPSDTTTGAPPGPTGPQGPAGTPGEKWFTGAGAPSGATGIVGDWYLNSDNGDYYEKTGSTTWTLRGNLKGVPGTTEVYEQPGAPSSPNVGALWVDTDDSPAVVAYQQLTVGTVFPPSPAAGDMHIYPADGVTSTPAGAGTGVSWQFYYVGGQWRFIGGPPLHTYDADTRTINSTTSPAPAVPTDPMSITLPFAGDWEVEASASIFDQTGGGFNGINWGYLLSGVTVVNFVGWGGNQWVSSLPTTRRRHTGIAASATVSERARVSAGTGSAGDRAFNVWPVRYTP